MAVLSSSVVNGNLSVTGNVYATYFYSSSDQTLKENIKDVDIDFKDIVERLKLKEFNFISDESKRPLIGVMAQELEEVLPEKYIDTMIYIDLDGKYAISETKLIYFLIGALQEEIKRNDTLEQRLARLEEMNGISVEEDSSEE